MYEDYYCQTRSKSSFIEFMRSLYLQFNQLNVKNKKYEYYSTLCVCNLYRMYNSFKLNSYAKMYNIKYVPGYKFETTCGNEISIINPSNKITKYIHKMNLEYKLRLKKIINELKNDNIIILSDILQNKEFDEIDEVDLSINILQNNPKYLLETEISIYNDVVKDVFIKYPVPKQNLKECLEILKNEHLVLLNPENNLHTIALPEIKGVIINKDTSTDVLDLISHFDKKHYYGTGQIIC